MNLLKIELDNLNKLCISKYILNTCGDLYIKDENTLYKIFKDPFFFDNDVKRNIVFLKNNYIKNTPKVYDEIYMDGIFIGYSMEYIKYSVSLRNAIDDSFNEDIKINAINDIYDALKQLHRNNIIIGDVHSDNFLITAFGKGYIVDLDYIRFSKDKYKFFERYLIKPKNNIDPIYKECMWTDNVKTMLSSLSILLNVDFENYISSYDHSICLKDIFDKVIVNTSDEDLIEYFNRLIKMENVEYFSDTNYFKKLHSKIKVKKY